MGRAGVMGSLRAFSANIRTHVETRGYDSAQRVSQISTQREKERRPRYICVEIHLWTSMENLVSLKTQSEAAGRGKGVHVETHLSLKGPKNTH